MVGDRSGDDQTQSEIDFEAFLAVVFPASHRPFQRKISCAFTCQKPWLSDPHPSAPSVHLTFGISFWMLEQLKVTSEGCLFHMIMELCFFLRRRTSLNVVRLLSKRTALSRDLSLVGFWQPHPTSNSITWCRIRLLTVSSKALNSSGSSPIRDDVHLHRSAIVVTPFPMHSTSSIMFVQIDLAPEV
jgi:hypothetical protein